MLLLLICIGLVGANTTHLLLAHSSCWYCWLFGACAAVFNFLMQCSLRSGHGRCLLDGICLCQPGWRLPSQACFRECDGGAANPCFGNGACLADGTCACDPAYRLFNCSLMCPGGPDPSHICSGRGTCDALAICHCNTGWEGVDCQMLAKWVIACIIIATVLICCLAAIAGRMYYIYLLRKKRRARREVRQNRHGRTRIIEGRRAAGYTILPPKDNELGMWHCLKVVANCVITSMPSEPML